METYLLSAWSSFLDQADNFFLPCPFKALTGFDCPGCGFQRSFFALLKGDLQESFHLYPPTIPLLITFAVVLSARYLTGRNNDKLVKTLYLITGTIIIGSYLFKIFAPHQH
ncbi:hypothetical protein ABIE26_004645 [Pedobacter africanus]|uniref:Uncharacterized protein n=1 Tax=Pedobacter africanus TaxID=151894 RepID=A0ACC6L323_9SPHI|nr:DUF2752 domain-containing protein [Pedobacter africanus]MDR6785886.1 hypothetical protein [Pedobacter africanus]